MNVQDRKKELFQAFKQRPPYLTEQEIKDYVDRRLEEEQRKPISFAFGKYRASVVWAAAVVCVLVVCLLLLLKSGTVTKEQIVRIMPQAESNRVSPGPKLHQREAKTTLTESHPSEVDAKPRRGLEPERTPATHNESQQIRTEPFQVKTSFANWVPRQMKPLKIYELEPQELEKLGVRIFQNGNVEIHFRRFTVNIKYSENDSTARSSRRIYNLEHLNPGDRKDWVSPSTVTDEKGQKIFYAPDDTNLVTVVQRSIPIKVIHRPGVGSAPGEPPKYSIIWYKFSEDLLLRLPDRVRKEILLNDEMMVADARIAGSPLIDEIHLSHDSKSAIVSFRDRDEEQIALSLYDLRGGLLESVFASSPCGKDICNAAIPLNKVGSGIYLVSIHTDNGKSDSRRLFLQ
jgi:hypothetical protein